MYGNLFKIVSILSHQIFDKTFVKKNFVPYDKDEIIAYLNLSR